VRAGDDGDRIDGRFVRESSATRPASYDAASNGAHSFDFEK
jgi:hypothetical protein